MRRAATASTLFALALLAIAAPASAQSKGDDQPDFMRAPIVTTRRHGFTLGFDAAPMVVFAHGTPTAYAERDAAHTLQLGPTIAPRLSGWVGYALADELSFTLAIEPALYRRDDVKLSGVAFAFRIEVWPLTSLGGRWRDLGLVARAGIGSLKASRSSTGEALAASGTYSLVGLDVVFDALRVGGLALGPSLGIARRSSETWEETDLSLGVRAAFYGGP